MAERKIMCPKYCGVALHKIKVKDVQVDQCPKCEGVWFDGKGEELYKTIRTRPDELAEQLKKSWHEDPHPHMSRKHHKYNCPRCGLELKTYWFGAKDVGTFLVDGCKQGCGVWLDDGELGAAYEVLRFDVPAAKSRTQPGFLQKLWRIVSGT